eukprot:CAMPEP_0197552760 /NCGR_PEP_ID=MMETSP1320-20131121/7051_1 /TAXON_ID=91990 /ORGANISM="Bolidomonas sp., Strain RCC2347" /LENGTH=107 /DNA_ID=CAMNT_0043113413 /DNA_START=182 /DNA_END=501 /DNA_ORIENTATION=+
MAVDVGVVIEVMDVEIEFTDVFKIVVGGEADFVVEDEIEDETGTMRFLLRFARMLVLFKPELTGGLHIMRGVDAAVSFAVFVVVVEVKAAFEPVPVQKLQVALEPVP